MAKKAIVIYSGGMDSTVLLYKLLNRKKNKLDISCINFYYGSKHNRKEREQAIKICTGNGIRLDLLDVTSVMDIHKTSSLTGMEAVPEGYYTDATMKSTVVPFRNGIMLSIAAGIAESVGAKVLAYGAHAGDHVIYPDCRPKFMRGMHDAILYGTYNRVCLSAPFIHKNKWDIVREGARLKVPFIDTWSCYKGEEYHCGVCGTCTERREAFSRAHVIDPTFYTSDIKKEAK